MKPYFETERGKLYHGDCLEVLDSLENNIAHAVVTDPPYCSGGFNEVGKKQAAGQGLRSEIIREIGWFVNDNMTTAGLIWLLRVMSVHAHRLIENSGSLCVFTDWRMVPHLAPALESSGLRYQNMLVWDKGNPGLGIGFRPAHEIILHYVKGTGEFYSKSAGNVLHVKRITHQNKFHQTEKPVELLSVIIQVITDEGQTVIDPFFGSGSTGFTCETLGRKWIGIEKTEEYCEIAAKRIENESKQGKLWSVEQSLAPDAGEPSSKLV
jgi:DNA modification methylase